MRPGNHGAGREVRPVSADLRALVQHMSQTHPLWGAPRIPRELLQLGMQVAESTVGTYRQRHRKPPSQTWRTLLGNHLPDGLDGLFTVPTATFRVLFVLVVLSHDGRRIVHFSVREHPTQEGTIENLGSVSLEPVTAVPAARPRRHLWPTLGGHHAGMGIEEVRTN